MKKHFWQPMWKFEEVESELATLEQNGWRLRAIHRFRCFEFVKSTPKNTRYFFTYNPTRSTEDMYPVEYSLKQNHKATPISGHLSEFLSTVKFFRITDDTDVAELIRDRNFILKRILFKRILLGFTLLLLVLIPLIIGLVLNPQQFISNISIGEIVIISAYSICVTFSSYTTQSDGFIKERSAYMITFEDFKTVLTHKVCGNFCIEIKFRVIGLADYSYCWMGKTPDTDNPSKDAYWFGLASDGSKAYDYDTFDAFSSAPVFNGQSLKDVWDKVEFLSVDGCDPEERIRYLLS